jgi:DNA-binding PadR family transcriptional regulator
MSPVFRHGRLRLYLLKLLDESPRHGYEVIRLLQDRFLGVYAPSPGTIYPRLARLEEDGLVTHEEVDGKKVYSITDKGREEIRSRISDLADLEDELTESLRDVAREISEDVRETVRGIREELSAAAREFRSQHAGTTGTASGPGATSGAGTASGAGASGATDAEQRASGAEPGADDARRIREEARRARDEMRDRFRTRSGRDWSGWQDRAGSWSAPWSAWAEAGDAAEGGAAQRAGRGGQTPFNDLERMAIQFATELRAAAKQAGGVGERSLSDLRDILTDTLTKVRSEVFAERGEEKKAAAGQAGDTAAGADDDKASGADEQPGQA